MRQLKLYWNISTSIDFLLPYIISMTRARALTVENSRKNMTLNCRECVAVVCALISMLRYLLLTPIATAFQRLGIARPISE